jgi:tRNA (mo5U34)-methyltransferase
VNEALPTSPDDPRLDGWYHTVELGNGLRSKGTYDLSSTVHLYGLPDSLKGMKALDVGTWDGFWAFELERRGADEVGAIDIERRGDLDWLPQIREGLGAKAEEQSEFWIARAMLGSRVERTLCSVYDLSNETVGTYDLVFCGSLLMRLFDPLKALVNICSVTKHAAIVSTLLSEEPERAAPDKPWVSFGHREHESPLGLNAIYWKFNTSALQELMRYAGFERTVPLEPVMMPPSRARSAVVVGYPDREGDSQ